MFTLDRVDMKILELLQENARMSLKDISSQVFLTSPAVSARIEKLERVGVIEGYHAKINREAFSQLMFTPGAQRQALRVKVS